MNWIERAARNMRSEPGWTGMFTRERAPGALACGTTIRKVRSDPGDAHPDGSIGTVLGSVPVSRPIQGARYFYFVEWRDAPCVACTIVDFRIAAEPEPKT